MALSTILKHSTQHQDEYKAYLEFLKTPQGKGYYQPTSIEEYFRVKESGGLVPTTSAAPTEKTSKGPVQFLLDISSQHQEEYNAYLAFLKTEQGQGFPVPKDIMDYFQNREKWFKDWEQYVPKGEKPVDPYALSPEEAARRREEAYAEGRYAAQERYGEQPMYSQTFAKWMDEQRGFSGALSEYVEGQFPSLRAQFESGVGRLTGFPTREEARAEAARREQAWEGWLTRATPEIYQDYMGQRPSARGEKYHEYSPTLRSVNF